MSKLRYAASNALMVAAVLASSSPLCRRARSSTITSSAPETARTSTVPQTLTAVRGRIGNSFIVVITPWNFLHASWLDTISRRVMHEKTSGHVSGGKAVLYHDACGGRSDIAPKDPRISNPKHQQAQEKKRENNGGDFPLYC